MNVGELGEEEGADGRGVGVGGQLDVLKVERVKEY